MIKHNTSAVIVFQSIQYSDFRMITGNRGLNQGKINRIISEIEKGNDMLCYYPIQVRVNDAKMEILDGQHRFYISKKLKRPVHYILIAEQKSMSDIANINSNVEKWTPQNFLDCYLTQGDENYAKLKAFIDQYGFGIGVAIQMLANGHPGNEGTNEDLTRKFQNGKFEVNKWDEAVAVAEDINKFSGFTFKTTRGFVIAIYRIKKAGLISIDDLAEAYNRHPDMLLKQATFKSYVTNLEQIVNKNKQKRIVIL